MKGMFWVGLVLLSVQQLSAQGMVVKQYNFTTFTHTEKFAPQTIAQQTSDRGKNHPEYGIRPFNTQCDNCVELIDKRTEFARHYINPYRPNVSYSQQSYFPLHYRKNESDYWHTIDYRLKPDSAQPGIYEAFEQPIPVIFDLNSPSTALQMGDFTFRFNQRLTLYFVDEKGRSTSPQLGDYQGYTIGDDGLYKKDFWTGIGLEEIADKGAVKSNFVISSPLALPVSSGWMVIEDHFTLPEGYRVKPAAGGEEIAGHYFRGHYLISNDRGEDVALYKRPVYLDAKAYGEHGQYELQQDGNHYTLKMLVPVAWLKNPSNTYPIVVDPTVVGIANVGNFEKTGLPSAGMRFTSMALGSCDYHLTDTVPGKSKLTNAYVDLEYRLTYNPACGNPPLPAPFCTFSQVTMEVICDTCQTTTGYLACNPALPPFTGACTTDPNLVPGASALLINNFTPNYLACLPPQCPDYVLDFTLKNRDSICGDVCGDLCADGHKWMMTIEACTVEGSISQDKTQVCAGEPVTFTAHPNCGVPPYHYYWTQDGGNTFDTVYNSADYVIHPQADVIVGCYVADACENLALTNDLNVAVVPSPPADAGQDRYLCEGGTVQIGGNPTTSGGSSVQWTAENSTAQTWLSNAAVPNPVVTVPAGVVDTFFYVLRTSDFTCYRTDTVVLYSVPRPTATITANGSVQVCAGQAVTLAADKSYAQYQWSNGETSASSTTQQAGDYYVIVTDQNGCRDTSNTITVSYMSPPPVQVYPDTLIFFGDSVMLYSDYDLSAATVDSFFWYPTLNITCTNCLNPVVAPESQQYYGVVVYAGGCSVSDSALIRVILPNNFYIPNAFTPNGDGNNDNFYVLSQSGVRVLLFQVFNRLGEKVHDGDYPWNGTYRGKPAPAGVYVYLFKLGLYGEDRSVLKKGSITLIR